MYYVHPDCLLMYPMVLLVLCASSLSPDLHYGIACILCILCIPLSPDVPCGIGCTMCREGVLYFPILAPHMSMPRPPRAGPRRQRPTGLVPRGHALPRRARTEMPEEELVRMRVGVSQVLGNSQRVRRDREHRVRSHQNAMRWSLLRSFPSSYTLLVHSLNIKF